MKQKKQTGKSVVYYYVRGILPSLCISMLLVCALAFITTKKDLPVDILPYLLVAIGGIGSFIYACITAKNRSLRGILNGVLSSFLFSVVYILICLICSGFAVNAFYLIMLAVNLFVGCVGGIIMKNIRK